MDGLPMGDLNAGASDNFIILNKIDASGRLELPAGSDFVRADFVRSGPDLQIETPDGNHFLVPAFFMSETPPDLVTAWGGILSSDVVAKLTGPMTPGMTAAHQDDHILHPDLGDPIGSITELEGLVQITRADGSQLTLVTGGNIFQGDVLETGAGSSIGIVFADDTMFSLGEGGRMVMDEMIYDPGTQEGAFSATILTGTFSFVSGQIAKTSPDAMVLSTPVATMGIRGSTGLGKASAEGSENKITLVPDIDGNLGELVITTQAGTQVLNQANATTTITSAFAPPSQVTWKSVV